MPQNRYFFWIWILGGWGATWHYVIVNSKLYQVAYLWKELADAILTHSCPLNLELKCRSYGHLKNEKLFPPLFDSRKESFQDSYDTYDNLGFQPTWKVSICPSHKNLLNPMANKEALFYPILFLMIENAMYNVHVCKS